MIYFLQRCDMAEGSSGLSLISNILEMLIEDVEERSSEWMSKACSLFANLSQD
jgi:hypothetical protein